MTGDIIVRLINVTKYFHDFKQSKQLLDYVKQNKDERIVEVNQVTIHLYRGEVLGIVGIEGSGKSIIGKLMAKVIEPSIGKVRNNKVTFLASHNHLFEDIHSVGQMIENTLLAYNIPLSEFNRKKNDIIQFAELEAVEKKQYDALTLTEKSQLLIALTYFLKPDVVIYDNLTASLSDTFKEKFEMVIDLLKKEERAIVLMEEEVDVISRKANYTTWISHGQVRRDGIPKEVLPTYRTYLTQLKQAKYRKADELFDLDYKMKRHQLAGEPVMRRVAHHTSSFFREDVKRMFLASLILLSLIVVMAVLTWKEVSYTPASLEQTTTIGKNHQPPIVEKYALGMVMKDTELTIGKDSVQLPIGTLLEITGYNNREYNISYQNKQATIEREDLYYINPAALYEDISFSDLKPFIHPDYYNLNGYINNFLGKSHSDINKDLYPETNDRFKVKLTKNEVTLHFNDTNHMTGISFPIVKEEELKKKYDITEDHWIVKSGSGYLVANLKNNTWYYYEL